MVRFRPTRHLRRALVVAATCILLGSGWARGAADPGERPVLRFRDDSRASLPPQVLVGRSMDAEAADVDGDGDLDLFVAKEFGANVLLLNDGSGQFTDVSRAKLPQPVRDTEDIAAADFDGDGDVDLVFVSEDDFVNEYYLNDGAGTFTDASDRLPVTGESNAVANQDLDGDGDQDLLIGNVGQDEALINDGAGHFTLESVARLGRDASRTQDLQLADIDRDGDADLVQANEDGNRLLLNDGTGHFADATAARLPPPTAGEETRQAALGDVDGDGDLDLYFANVAFAMQRNPQDRLLLNDGNGHFTDATARLLAPEADSTVDARFIDLDRDGDLDLLRANAFGGGSQALTNDGSGRYTNESARLLPAGAGGDGIDIVTADLTGDGLTDLYLCHYRSPDALLVGVGQTRLWLPWAGRQAGDSP